MRVRASTPEIIELRGRKSVGTPLIVGCAMLAWPPLAAVIAEGPPTTERLLAAFALVALASAFIALGWPRAYVVRIRPRERTLQVARRRASTIGDDAVFRLMAAPAKPVAGPLRYGVALERRGAEPVLLLTDNEPASVLRDLGKIREHLPLPVLAGWGLSHAAVPWLTGVTPAVSPARAREDDPVEPVRRRATTAMCVVTAGAVGLLVMEAHGRASGGGIALPVSLILPALSICILGTITFVVAALKPRISAGRELSFAWRLGALRLFPRSIDAATVRGAEVVSPTGARGRHLLMFTEQGDFVAFPCERSEGESAAARVAEQRSAAT
jgi:hypothetical protein